MIADVVASVHTVGINWVSVATIVCSSVTVLSVVLGFIIRTMARYISGQITTAITQFRVEVIEPMASDVAALKAMGRRR